MEKKERNVPLSQNEIILEFRIKEVAKSKGLKLKDVAERMEKSASYISRIDSGEINTTITTLQSIADAIEVPVHELIKLPKGYGHFYVDGEWQGIRKI